LLQEAAEQGLSQEPEAQEVALQDPPEGVGPVLVPLRDENGRLLPGQTANPHGRPLGSKNRATLVKHFIEEKLTNKLEKDAIAIMQQAITLAKQGDKAMIKLLLGDMLASARGESAEGAKGGSPPAVRIILENYTGAKARVPEIIDAEVL